ncbi:MAG: MlaE family lipid ABC transporter permease subunit [Alphaproteobacteria bacterium]|nr:MlaE family lipid ABC transporter permease subunit [Pseudomonadota bacterium]MCZ6483798.1 MlaE family lipid ABC transporter permease subunit [Alphaproteobacteria bacterium]MCZ6743706.1 MlaE family lipid ABC transporter permease subunit [Alphaproteobacteria bacterium]
MRTASGWFKTEREGERLRVIAGGSWETGALSALDGGLRRLAREPVRFASIDLSAVDSMDTAGAWVLYRTRRDLRARGVAAEFEGVDRSHADILARVEKGDVEQTLVRDELHPVIALIAHIGEASLAVFQECASLLSFLGVTVITLGRSIVRPRRIRFTSLVSHIEQVGLNAIPIVGLLSFLIGVVIAYQGAEQLRQFGAQVFTVNLLGISMLREMAILMTAIVVAGRSGSAFTAQIGTMQVNEEVDAMRTMGLDPIEVLVLPRVFALIIALPLLTVLADLTGLAGGALATVLVVDISLAQFMERLNDAVPLAAFWVGIVKAPVFGFLIAMVGCREGLVVAGSAESVGRHTTKSVVLSIFLVIVADALFSIFFLYIGV